MKCNILVKDLPANPWEDLLANHWSPKEVYLYVESRDQCLLSLRPWSQIRPEDDWWEGRIFDGGAELRWQRLTDDLFRAWLTQEVGEGGTPVVRTNRKYYLLGEASHDGNFREGRYPGKTFDYPLKSKKEEADRVFVWVAEYRRAMPDWEKCQGNELDGPLLMAHRFFNLDIGRDPYEKA